MTNVQARLPLPRLLISAAHKSSGKTTVTMGIARALADRGITVQTFKKGPDYIDPMWHGRASGRACYNLDFNTQSPDEIAGLVAERSRGAGVALFEGNKGLYDGVDLDGADSNAALAKLLRAPVVLVVDTEGITRGIAPLLVGYKVFDPEVSIAGVILNKVAGPRHEGKLRAAVERYSGLQVLGALRRDARLALAERHLGLTTPAETGMAENSIRTIAAAVRDGIDLDALLVLANGAPLLPDRAERDAAVSVAMPPVGIQRRVRIAVARDTAFGFYYPDDLERLAAAGADLIFFDALRDAHLPAADGLLIGGGFPETQAAGLEANASLRADIAAAIRGGLPAYAECGGLMYLCRTIEYAGVRREMVGIVPGDAFMCEKPQGRGQVKLAETAAMPWPSIAGQGGEGWNVNAHEFHYAAVRNLPDGLAYAFGIERGAGIDGRRDGLVIHNLVATFSHQRHTVANPWASRFVAFVRQCSALKRAAE